MKNKIIYTVLFMVIITAFYTSILALMNEQTYAKINENQILKDQKSILYIFNIPINENAGIKEIQSLYERHITYQKQQDFSYYEGKTENNEIIGLAFPMKGN